MSITSPRACPLPLRTPRSCKCDFLPPLAPPPPPHQPPRRNTTLTPTIVSLLPVPLLPSPSVFLLLRRLRRPLFLGLPRPTVRACIRPVPLSPVHTGLLAGRRGGAERAAAREAHRKRYVAGNAQTDPSARLRERRFEYASLNEHLVMLSLTRAVRTP